MTKKRKNPLADDIRAGLSEALKFARGEKADVIVHRVVPSASKARAARRTLGIEAKPKAVARALKSKAS